MPASILSLNSDTLAHICSYLGPEEVESLSQSSKATHSDLNSSAFLRYFSKKLPLPIEDKTALMSSDYSKDLLTKLNTLLFVWHGVNSMGKALLLNQLELLGYKYLIEGIGSFSIYKPDFVHLFKSPEEGGIGLNKWFIVELFTDCCYRHAAPNSWFIHSKKVLARFTESDIQSLFLPPDKGGIGLTLPLFVKLTKEARKLTPRYNFDLALDYLKLLAEPKRRQLFNPARSKDGKAFLSSDIVSFGLLHAISHPDVVANKLDNSVKERLVPEALERGSLNSCFCLWPFITSKKPTIFSRMTL